MLSEPDIIMFINGSSGDFVLLCKKEITCSTVEIRTSLFSDRQIKIPRLSKVAAKDLHEGSSLIIGILE